MPISSPPKFSLSSSRVEPEDYKSMIFNVLQVFPYNFLQHQKRPTNTNITYIWHHLFRLILLHECQHCDEDKLMIKLTNKQMFIWCALLVHGKLMNGHGLSRERLSFRPAALICLSNEPPNSEAVDVKGKLATRAVLMKKVNELSPSRECHSLCIDGTWIQLNIIDILCDSSAYPSNIDLVVLAQQPLSFIDLIVGTRGHCGRSSQISQWI